MIVLNCIIIYVLCLTSLSIFALPLKTTKLPDNLQSSPENLSTKIILFENNDLTSNNIRSENLNNLHKTDVRLRNSSDITKKSPYLVRRNRGLTPEGIWKDTRLHLNPNKPQPQARMTKEQDVDRNYYPRKNQRQTVCAGSTIYNGHIYPKVIDFSSRSFFYAVLKTRPLFEDLRRGIFTYGNYNECHDPVKYTKWRDYIHCALRINQRLEYLIPKYPLIQRGYFMPKYKGYFY